MRIRKGERNTLFLGAEQQLIKTRYAGVRKGSVGQEHGEEQGIYVISLHLPINYLLVTKKNIVTVPRGCKHSLTRLIKMNEYTNSRRK